MPTIQRSIEVKVPITRLYAQLTRFEDYPRFLEDVESVHKTDIRHLHWTVKKEDGLVEWDAELTEQEENRQIVWHDAHDQRSNGRIDMDELGPNLSKLTFTLNTIPGRITGLCSGDTEEEIAQRLNHDLENLKDFLEDRGPRFDAQHISLDTADAGELDAQAQADIMNEAREPSTHRTAASVSGSPTEVLEDEPNESGVDGLIKPDASGHASSSDADQRKPAK